MTELTQIYRRQSKKTSDTRLALPDNIDERIRNAEDFISTSGKRAQSLRESLDRQIECIEVIRESAYSPIDYLELMAVLGMKYGISKESLFPYAKSVSSMVGRGFLSGGEMSELRLALGKNLPSRVLGTLETSNTPYTSSDIAKILGTENTRIMMVGISFTLLETMNTIVRLPHNSTVPGGPYMWMHSNFRYTEKTIPHWSLKYMVLLALNDGTQLSAKDLSKDERVRAVARVTKFWGGEYPHFKDSLNDLILSGLAEYNVKPIGGRRTTVYSIMPQGARLLKSTQDENYLNEELRVALLGEKYKRLKPSEILALDRVRRVANVYLMGDVRGARTDLARRTGFTLGSINNIVYGGRDPLRFFNEATLRNKFFPLLTPEEISGLEIYLQTRKK